MNASCQPGPGAAGSRRQARGAQHTHSARVRGPADISYHARDSERGTPAGLLRTRAAELKGNERQEPPAVGDARLSVQGRWAPGGVGATRTAPHRAALAWTRAQQRSPLSLSAVGPERARVKREVGRPTPTHHGKTKECWRYGPPGDGERGRGGRQSSGALFKGSNLCEIPGASGGSSWATPAHTAASFLVLDVYRECGRLPQPL